jgi:pimeloyl-ACP methyl ester carboxylesterase
VVFVAHSYGGLILDLLARTHPDLVAGIVMVDGVSECQMTLSHGRTLGDCRLQQPE